MQFSFLLSWKAIAVGPNQECMIRTKFCAMVYLGQCVIPLCAPVYRSHQEAGCIFGCSSVYLLPLRHGNLFQHGRTCVCFPVSRDRCPPGKNKQVPLEQSVPPNLVIFLHQIKRACMWVGGGRVEMKEMGQCVWAGNPCSPPGS